MTPRWRSICATEQPTDVPPELAVLFVPMNQNFMKSLTSFDPPAAIRAVRQPVLIVQVAVICR